MDRAPEEDAAAAQLRYVTDASPGWTRTRAGTGFCYRDANGAAIKDKTVLQRIYDLAIPPAWESVWICPYANGHIQATGRDAKGRKQFIYNARFRDIRDSAKFDHVLTFARALPAIRRRVSRDLARQGLPREKLLAAIVRLLETTLIRVGNEDYAAKNNSYGLTTLRDRHAQVEGDELRFAFVGKAGKTWNIKLKDRRLAKIVKSAQELPGQQLFQYVDADGARRGVTSSDVNEYLRTISGGDFTAKDFRTWAGTVIAALSLAEFEIVDSETAAKRNVRAAIERVAATLGNTPTICRKCYVHPAIVDSYLDKTLADALRREIEKTLRSDLRGLRSEEAAVLALLHRRLARAKRRAVKPRSAPRPATAVGDRRSRRRRAA
jgi:DNA topoisomerase-1